MAEKSFGVKEVNLIGASGTPTITSPNNLNLSAVNVAISTNATIGGTLSVTGNVSVGGTLTYEDVTNIDSVGLITARSGIVVKDDATFETANSNNIVFDKSDNALEFGNGVKSVFNNNLQIYNDGTNRIKGSSGGIFIGLPGAFQIKDQNFSNTKFEAGGTHATLYSAGAPVARSHEARFEVGNPEVGIGIAATITTSGDARFVGVVTASTFSGSGASLTNLPLSNTDVQVLYTVTANGSSAYRFAGNGIVSTADNPDVYLIRGLKYRFVNNSGGSHPFQIRESSGGSAYSAGVTNNGAASGNIDFQVPYSAPSHLYYQCTAHGGMVGNLYIRGAGGQNTNVGVTTFNPSVILAGSGASAQLELKRTNTNVTGAIGAVNFTALDGHSVANMYALGDGDNEGAHLIFKTTSAAAENNPYGTGTIERVRITSGGKVNIGGDYTQTTRQLGVVSSAEQVASFEYNGADADGSEVRFYHNSASPADDDTLAFLQFSGKNSANEVTMYSSITAKSTDVTNGTEDGNIIFSTRSAGSFSEKLRIASDGKIKLGSGGDPVGAAKVEIRYDNPVLLIRDTAESSADNDAKIGFGNNTHYPVAYLSHVWDGTNGALTFHTRVGGNEYERLRIGSTGLITVNRDGVGGRIDATAGDASIKILDGNGRSSIKVSDPGSGNSYQWELTSAGNFKAPTGTTKGIDFSAKTNLSGATDTTLAHYEEGTWTPSFANLDVPSHVTIDYATYTRVGRIVTISAKFSVSSSVNDGSGFGFSLPYGPISDRQIVLPAISDRSGSNKDPFCFNNVYSSHLMMAKTLEGYAFQNYNSFSGNYIVVTGSYETDA